MEVVNSNGGAAVEKASACESRGIVRPRGMIPGAQVGGGANVLHWAAWVLWSRSLCCVWCHSRCLCTTCGVTGAVVAPRVVLWSWLLRHVGVAGAIVLRVVWCHGCSRCAAWVLQVPSLCCVWCRGHSCALCGVVVAVILLCVMLQLWWLALEGEEGYTSVGKGGGRVLAHGI